MNENVWKFSNFPTFSLLSMFRVSNYGTVLYIESVQYMPDGRSVIKTRGERRFEIEKVRLHDGLHMATIQFIADVPITNGKCGTTF